MKGKNETPHNVRKKTLFLNNITVSFTISILMYLQVLLYIKNIIFFGQLQH